MKVNTTISTLEPTDPQKEVDWPCCKSVPGIQWNLGQLHWVCMASFWYWGCYRGWFHEKLPPCQTETMPASSILDTPLAKAKFSRYSGSLSALMYCRRKRNYHVDVISAREGQAERNKSADTKVTTERGIGGTPGTRAEVLLQPVVRQLCPHNA